MCAPQRNAHCIQSMYSENQLRQASSEAIQLCAEEAEFRPTIRYNEDVFHHERKNRVPASDAQEVTDILSA